MISSFGGISWIALFIFSRITRATACHDCWQCRLLISQSEQCVNIEKNKRQIYLLGCQKLCRPIRCNHRYPIWYSTWIIDTQMVIFMMTRSNWSEELDFSYCLSETKYDAMWRYDADTIMTSLLLHSCFSRRYFLKISPWIVTVNV